MDLSSLDSTLPPALADAERDMGDKFRASALNITTMYKSSLGYMKQAYGVGYAACLADVLSTVQSSMSAGQDPEQTLSRLMDWAEARETAMTALANDDDDSNHTPHMNKTRPSRTTLARQAMAHNTPVSVPSPVPVSVSEKEDDPRGRSRHAAIPMMGSTPLSTDSSIQYEGSQSSSPLVSTGSSSRPMIKHRHSTSHSPTKSTHHHLRPESSSSISSTSATASTSTSRLPQISESEFAPAIPSHPHPNPHSTPQSMNVNVSSSSNLAPGSKRPLMDVDMADSNTLLPAPPITPARGPRSAKRRSLGLGISHKEDEERGSESRDRRRGGRRGHGHGHGHGHGGPGQQAL